MSHEVRTPIHAMLGYVDMLSDPAAAQALKDHAAAAVRRNGAHLLRLINDILDLSKVEACRMELELRLHSPQQAIGDALGATRLQAAEFGVELTADSIGPTPKLIPTDATRLRQILMNLIGNAVKHSGAWRCGCRSTTQGATTSSASVSTSRTTTRHPGRAASSPV